MSPSIDLESQAEAGSRVRGAAVAAPAPILVVENDRAVSQLLIVLLEERGFEAVAAYDGREAVRLARQLQPRLITLDLALPGLNGHAVLEQLKADPATRGIPIVVISAFIQVSPSGDRRKLAYLLGTPFDVSEILDLVQATVGNPYL